MGAHITTEVAETWLRRWDAQQERYVADREERFTVLCDVVQAALEGVDQPVVVDLGCGPGSLAARLTARLPNATVIGIDSDPLLLGLARAHYGSSITWVDADLAGQTWQDKVPPAIHAAVSTTALHWLTEDQLAQLYRTLAGRIVPGGVFVNGDNIGFENTKVNDLAQTVRDRRAVRVGVKSNEEWHVWWEAVQADPNLAGLVQARLEKMDHTTQDHNGNGLTVAGHTKLLQAAGFSEVAPMWQVGDDHVLAAVR